MKNSIATDATTRARHPATTTTGSTCLLAGADAIVGCSTATPSTGTDGTTLLSGLTTYTNAPWGFRWIAAAGTNTVSRFVSTSNLTLTNWLGNNE